MSYWDYKPLYQQIKEIIAENPALTYTKAKALCVRPGLGERTNPWRPRLAGTQELARRKSQIERGFIKASA